MTDLEKIQKVLLSSANDICRLCESNNIPYFIIGGTQLGAIRHKGFIPWDDDIDIGMTRANYERFIELCYSKLDVNKYFLQTQNTELNYTFAFSKIQLLGTEIIEDFSKDVPIKHGIFVDIFPYDNLPDGKIKRRWHLFISYLLKSILWVKCGYGTRADKSKFRYKILNVISKVFGISFLKKMQYKWITRYNNIKTECCFACDYPRQILLNDWVVNLEKYEFENTWFYGIKEYDSYLKLMYGEYMVLPPIEKRVRHSYEKIDFGKY